MEIEQLKAMISQNETMAIGSDHGSTYRDREDAARYYHGEAKGKLAPPQNPEHSRVVSREIMEAVEWTIPDLVDIFISGDIYEFPPISQEDHDSAKQESKAINHVVLSQNNATVIFTTWMKDALIQMDGYVKAYWDERKETLVMSYEGMTDIQMTEVSHSLYSRFDDVEVIGQDERSDPDHGMVYDATFRVTGKVKQVVIENYPPDMMRVHKDSLIGLSDSQFVQGRKYLSRSALIEMGFSRKTVKNLPADNGRNSDNESYLARNRQTEDRNYPDQGEAMDDILYTETYLNVDYDGDGIAELRRVEMAGGQILSNEEFDHIAFCHLTPIIIPHKHTGLGYYDLLKDVQEINTALNRQMMNNVFAAGNAKTVVDENRVNMGDVLNRRFDQIIRTNGSVSDSYMPVTQDIMLNQLLPVIQYFENKKETRTGTGKTSQGLDSEVLRDTTADAFSRGLAASSALKKMIARTFADTGIRDLGLLVHKLMLKHGDKTAFLINEQWIPVNPEEWRYRYNLGVKTGLGQNDRQVEVAKMGQVAEYQGVSEQAGAGIVTPQNAYNLAEDMVEMMGFKRPGRYFTPPDQVPPKEPQTNPLVEAEQIKQQTKMLSLKAQAAMEKVKGDKQAELEVMKIFSDAALKIADMELKYNSDIGQPGIGAELENVQ